MYLFVEEIVFLKRMKPFHSTTRYLQVIYMCAGTLILFFVWSTQANAATLRLSPDTGVYTVGGTFTVSVIVNTQNKPINAADAVLSFSPRELSVVSVSRSSSIFGLWTEEPRFSNVAGTVSFGGGSPSGYTGASGAILSVTFKVLSAGNPKVLFKSGSILAADGMGTNVLTAMNGGTYTAGAQVVEPSPEYVAPANTPKAPVVTSDTHAESTGWSKVTTAKLSWNVPSDVIAVRTLLDSAPSTIPTVVYDEPISSRTIDDLPQGVSYFHVQFKNEDGWGKVAHYRLAVDTESPKGFTISESTEGVTNPSRTLVFSYEDTSPVSAYSMVVDGGDPVVFKDTEIKKQYTLEAMAPGKHTVVVTAEDAAGNVAVASYTFEVFTIEAPRFTEYPERLSTTVVPALRGTTVSNAQVHVLLRDPRGGEVTFEVTADAQGTFTVIPDSTFDLGVYELSAYAVDTAGATSDRSVPVRIIVEAPGYIRVGTFVVSVLSVLIPLIALCVLLVFGVWYGHHVLKRARRRVSKEAHEAEDALHREIAQVIQNINIHITELQAMRATKTTKAEAALFAQIEADLGEAEVRIRKEITDIEHIVE